MRVFPMSVTIEAAQWLRWRMARLSWVLAGAYAFSFWTAFAVDAVAHEDPTLARRAALEANLARIVAHAGGKVGISLVHVEAGQGVAVGGQQVLPLYSVFKLPLAVVILKEVEAGKLALEKKVAITRADVAPGARQNTEQWHDLPLELSVRQLLERSIVDSDNTSTDKLLGLIGGATALTKRLRELGVDGIDIRATTKEMRRRREHPSRGSAVALSKLLSTLQRGQILQPAERKVLWDMMARSQTGLRRLRGALPPGTPALDKTGTAPDGKGTNDVGVITLPQGRGHLAMAVLITDSKLTFDEQERLIAELGRAAYDTYAADP